MRTQGGCRRLRSAMRGSCEGSASARAVIPREESGGYSTPQLCDSIIGASEYWIARFRGRRRLRVLARSRPSLRANGSRECAPDDKLREAMHACRKESMDCFVASLLAMTSKRESTTSRRGAPESCVYLPPQRRAWGMPGAHCTRSLVCTLYW